MLILVIVVICAVNAWLGRRWSRLDRNPWAGLPLGGMFQGLGRPAFVPARLSVAQLNARGRIQLYLSPIVFALGILFILSIH
jgi:hypothetical protein